MTYQRPLFKFIDRGFKKNILLLPGWATDSGIFEKLDIPFNYLLPKSVSPGEAGKAIKHIPGEVWKAGISILGWSMGGFIAADLVFEDRYVFEKIVLISMRRRYGANGIEHIRACLRKNAKAYLGSFYKKLFADDEKQNKKWFRDGLLRKYIDDMGSLYLFEGLDYLSNTELKVNCLNNPNVTFIHGENDSIAPLHEAKLIMSQAPLARTIFIKDARHLPFLREEFADIFTVENHAG